jgi:hypothetical protein
VVLIGLLYGLGLFRLDAMPDVAPVEAATLRAAQRIAANPLAPQRDAVALHASPLAAYLGGGILWLADAAAADPFQSIALLRALSITCIVLSVVLIALARRWHARGWGATVILLAFLVGSDPRLLLGGRRDLGEAAAVVCSCAALALLSRAASGLSRWRLVAVAVCLGLGLLAHEATVCMLTFPLAWSWHRHKRWGTGHAGSALVAVLLAILLYATVPLFMWRAGVGAAFFRGVAFRLAGSATPEPGLLLPHLPASWLGPGALLALGVLAMPYLLARGRRDSADCALGIWLCSAYLGFVGQFLFADRPPLPPFLTLLAAATAVSVVAPRLARAPNESVVGGGRRRPLLSLGVAISLLLVTLTHNGAITVAALTAPHDDGLRQLAAFLRAHVEPGTTLVLDEPLLGTLLPGYRTFDGTLTRDAAQTHDLHYFILGGADTADGPTDASEFQHWVEANSLVRFTAIGTTYQRLTLYYMASPDGEATATGGAGPGAQRLTAIQVAARPIPPSVDGPTRRYFTETGHSIEGIFKQAWERGGSTIYGYPLTEMFSDAGRRVQYFERALLRTIPTGRDEVEQIEVVPLGREIANQRAQEPAFAPNSAAGPGGSMRYFPETGRALAEPFLSAWTEKDGGRFLGPPVSEPFSEVDARNGRRYRVQYFERGRLQVPEGAANPLLVVEIGQLGREALDERLKQP